MPSSSRPGVDVKTKACVRSSSETPQLSGATYVKSAMLSLELSLGKLDGSSHSKERQSMAAGTVAKEILTTLLLFSATVSNANTWVARAGNAINKRDT